MFLDEWLNWFLRWAHLIAGISWIGSSFYFMWLDSHLTEPESREGKEDVEGHLWMTHSGGFYEVLRRRIGPGRMPKTLHWFKYEALFTWITGVFLLGIIYYLTNGAYLVDPQVAKLAAGTATAIGIAFLIGSWLIYDGIWITLGKKREKAATALCLGLLGGLAYALCHLFSGRAAYVHFGAVLGTLMVANVWVRILPAQQKMIDATKEGRTPDFTLSGYAKRRSVHNSYMTFPVLFMMLSNHYSMAYGHAWNWVILLLLTAFGISVRHVMIAKDGSGIWAWVPAGASALAILGITSLGKAQAPPASEASVPVSFHQVQAVIQQRCVGCHSEKPSDPTFGPSPGGVHLETPERIRALAERIRVRAVITRTMPLANKTGMTEEERELLARWVDQGARIDGESPR